MIGVVSIGMGNVPSIRSMFDRLDVPLQLVDSLGSMEKVSTLILPGVGSFDNGVSSLVKGGWVNALREFAQEKTVVGICLGMQLLLDESDEGNLTGLELIRGRSSHLTKLGEQVVPNVGWRTIVATHHTSPSLRKVLESNRFYFSHSYGVVTESTRMHLGFVGENERVLAAIQNGNIFGFQFHPERSQRGGLELFRWLSLRDNNEVQ